MPIVIIGGGVIGSAIAYFLTLQQPGCDVVVVERDPTYARASSAPVGQLHPPAVFYRHQHPDIGLRHWLLAQRGHAAGLPWRCARHLACTKAATCTWPPRRAEATLRENHALQKQHGADVALLEPSSNWPSAFRGWLCRM